MLSDFWAALRDVFAVRCPHCDRWLSRARSEDPMLDYQHTCYKCGKEFEEI